MMRMSQKNQSARVIAVGLLMFFYGIVCLLLWREKVGDRILFKPELLIISWLFGHRALDGYIFLVAGLAILLKRDWIRILVLLFSWIFFLPAALSAAGLIFYAIFKPRVIQPGNFFVVQQPMFGITAQSPATFFSVSVIVAMVCVPFIFYGFLIYFFTRPEVKMEFKYG